MEVVMLLITYLQDINFKVFNAITRINERKTFVKHISCDCKWRFNSITCNSIKNGMLIHVNIYEFKKKERF